MKGDRNNFVLPYLLLVNLESYSIEDDEAFVQCIGLLLKGSHMQLNHSAHPYVLSLLSQV
jgi:hypothetical protein